MADEKGGGEREKGKKRDFWMKMREEKSNFGGVKRGGEQEKMPKKAILRGKHKADYPPQTDATSPNSAHPKLLLPDGGGRFGPSLNAILLLSFRS